jgi:hypothetical protein
MKSGNLWLGLLAGVTEPNPCCPRLLPVRSNDNPQSAPLLKRQGTSRLYRKAPKHGKYFLSP